LTTVLEVTAVFFYFVPYRMLMVWVYDRTQSVLIAILMHLPLIVFVYGALPPATAGVPTLIFNLVFGATLWVFVAAVAAANHSNLSRPELGQPRLGSGSADERDGVSNVPRRGPRR
jgi:hypothetical protein